MPVLLLRSLLTPTLVSIAALLGAKVSFLLFHVLAEFFSIVIALTALVVATTSRHFTRNHFVVFIAVAIGWCAGLDILHTLAYRGMGLLPTDGANPATQLWIAARFLQAVALLVAPIFLLRAVRVGWLHFIFGSIATVTVVAIATGAFPDAYIDGAGLTPLKIHVEYLIIALLGVALFLFWRRRGLMSPMIFRWLAAAVVAMMVSEFMFTRYVDVYAAANMVGHIFKIFSYWFIYLALVETTLREPFGVLARAASTYDAVPDPTFIVDGGGVIRQANAAAARGRVGGAAGLVGEPIHPLFHDAAVAPEECPVCSRIAGGEERLLIEIERGDGSAVECSTAPFAVEGGARAHVHVVRDITERRRLVGERERLVLDLQERVKELRGLYAVAALSEEADLDIPGLLSGAAACLPDAFCHPAATRVWIDSEWGCFGAYGGPRGGKATERRITAGGREVGLLRVALSRPGLDFLPEEGDLLDTVAARLGEGIERLQASARVTHLTYLYEMLSATNRAIIRCRTVDELLQALFDALHAHATFPIIFSAINDDGGPPFRIARVDGVDGTGLPVLEQLLSGPGGVVAAGLPRLAGGESVRQEVPKGSGDPWLDYLYSKEIRSHALLPILREGRLIGVIGLGAHNIDAFDDEQARLLDEMAMDLSYALDTMRADERRRTAEEQALQSEHRFREVFAASPIPMQIHSATTGAVRAINNAHRRWLGYVLEEIPDEDEWFDRVYDDPELRRRLRAAWPGQIADARRTGRPVTSDELSLRCRDGGRKICVGTMTVVGDDVVVAWIDLTERKAAESQIRDYVRQLEGVMRSTLHAVSNMVEMRDPYTAGHERRTGLIAGAIAREMGWPEERCINLELIGLVHDIGKIAVPSEILSKPGRLSDLEMDLVRVHPQAGYDILKEVDFAVPVAEVILQHHERLDGSGYPRGLAGDEIMPEARVLAVADVLEAMSSHRPYRPTLGPEDAMAEIERGSGTLYDPEVVAAAIRLLREKGYTLPT